MQNLLDFIRSQRVLVMATHTQDPTPHPWVTNLYYVSDENPHFYIFGEKNVKWASDLEQNPQIAFSIVWSNPENANDRKGLQAVGEAQKSEEEQHLDRALDLYSQVFPIDREAFKQNVISGESGLYVVRPKFIKHWDDAAHGEEKVKHYEF